MRKITRKMALEVAHHEAVIRQAYKDSVGGWIGSLKTLTIVPSAGTVQNSGYHSEPNP